MQFEQKVEPDFALAEINAYLDTKAIFPKRRERLANAIEVVAEAMQYGYLSIDANTGKITQRLVKPIDDLQELVYAARVDPLTMNNLIAKLKVTSQGGTNKVYIMGYTGKLSTEIDKLENQDRDVAECISLFFQL